MEFMVVLAAIAFFISGVISLAIGTLLIVRMYRFLRSAKGFAGKVVDYEQRYGETLDVWVLHPVITYKDATGEKVTFTDPAGTSPPRHKVGKRVTVLIDPADPDNPEIESLLSQKLIPAFVLAMGAIFIAVGIALVS